MTGLFFSFVCLFFFLNAIYLSISYTGSSHILTPTVLLDDIKALSKGPMESFTLEVETKA